MTEYWKSIPKKYCDYCKIYYTDNKSSVEFHERGFKHQGNVKRKLNELRKKGAVQDREAIKYNAEMMKIEAAAMRSFQSDVANNPRLANQMSSTSSALTKLSAPSSSSTSSSSSKITAYNRFGEVASNEEESTTLVHGRQKAMETIAKKFEKKSRWLEAKTAEGKTYYWNKESMETKWEPPKSGFLSTEEQKYVNSELASSSSGPQPKYDPYGSWKTTQHQPFNGNMIDLQLPNQQLPEYLPPTEEVEKEKPKKMEFKERTVTSLSNSAGSSSTDAFFKKRKNASDNKRNVRQRNTDD